MKRARLWFLVLMAGVSLISGCAAVAVGGAAVGAGTGTYFYVTGELKTDYNAPFEKVWAACEKTVADMRGIDVVPSRDISKGTINTVIEGQEVQFIIDYKSKDLTSVSIRVGVLGDRAASQRLHDKVNQNLVKN